MIRLADAGDAEALGELWVESARAAFAPLLPAGHRLPDPQPERMRERVARRQERGEGGLSRVVPDSPPGLLVAGVRAADDQRAPPAIAGRITIVSLSATLVSSPSSTRTSSSFRYTFT